MPDTTSHTSSAAAARRWLTRPAMSRKWRARRFSGTIPIPTSLVTSTTRAGQRWQAAIRARPATQRAYALSKQVNPQAGKALSDEEKKILFGQGAR